MVSYPFNSHYGVLQKALTRPKRRIFISYHHNNDQKWYDKFSVLFSKDIELFSDNSVDRIIDSDKSEYLNRKIREEYIFGSSVTIVLCGSETWKRRWVDWEIYSTLYYEHALLGMILPTCSKSLDNKYLVPDRLYDNIQSGFASWMEWPQNAEILSNYIEKAINKSLQKSLIRNQKDKMGKSLS